MCFGMQPTEEKVSSGATSNTGSTAGTSNTSGTGSTNSNQASTGSSTALGSNAQSVIGSSNTAGSTNQATQGLQTSNGATNQVTAGQAVGNTANNTASTTSAVANPAVANAAVGNLDFVNQLQAKGFQGYGGQQVAGIAPGQQGTIDAATGIANNDTGARATGLIGGYASAPAQSVQTGTIANNMSPYMSQYVMQALAPQLRQMDISNARENAGVDATATGSGAFGDARAGIEASNTKFNQNVAREGLIGQAYQSAFNTAIGAGAQDVANQNSTQATNANLAETALGRSLGGAQALQGVQTQQLGNQATANALAKQNTDQQQAQLTAQYNQWLLAQQYPFQTAQLANSTIGTAASALPATQNTVGSQVGQNVQSTAGTTAGTTANTVANQGVTTGTNVSGTTNRSDTAGTTASTALNQNNIIGSSNTANQSNTAASGTSQSQGTNTGTSTTSKPNNSGLAVGGALLSAFI